MSELWYSPSDLLLFSPRVYYRLLDNNNRALWPLQMLTLGLGVAVAYLLVRPTRISGRVILAVLGLLWLWIAWSFFWQRYLTINWAAAYVVPIVALQGFGLMTWAAATGRAAFARPHAASQWVAFAVFMFALFGYPFVALAMGRPWSAAEVFGIAPDPTASATMAVLALAAGVARWLLMIAPSLWCVMTGLTLWAMDGGDFFVAPLCAMIAIASALSPAATAR